MLLEVLQLDSLFNSLYGLKDNKVPHYWPSVIGIPRLTQTPITWASYMDSVSMSWRHMRLVVGGLICKHIGEDWATDIITTSVREGKSYETLMFTLYIHPNIDLQKHIINMACNGAMGMKLVLLWNLLWKAAMRPPNWKILVLLRFATHQHITVTLRQLLYIWFYQPVTCLIIILFRCKAHKTIKALPGMLSPMKYNCHRFLFTLRKSDHFIHWKMVLSKNKIDWFKLIYWTMVLYAVV